MLRIVKTRQGKEYKSYTDLHCEIVIDNHLNYNDVVAELVIDRGIVYNVRRSLPDKLQEARDIDALYRYGYLKEGD